MNQEKIISFADKIIEFSFYALFFLVPLVLTPINYELFEYNKMMLTYGLTVIIMAAWIVKMISQGRILLCRTPFDLPLLLFFASQVISTIFSIDRHTSIWGYYSRSHGGLLSTVSYISLYYAFVTNFPREKIKKLITVTLTSAVLIAIYGVLEHFGIDKDVWVQDVQARVFSTLGQPNWLAAYLAVLIPVSMGMGLNSLRHFERSEKSSPAMAGRKNYASLDSSPASWRTRNDLTWKSILFFILAALFYLTLLYTRSRSGFLAIWISLGILIGILILWISHPEPLDFSRGKLREGSRSPLATVKRSLWSLDLSRAKSRDSSAVGLRMTTIVIGIFLIISFVNGIPFPQFNRFLLPGILNPKAIQNEPPPKGAALDTGVTESGEIRKIVWQGAIDILKAYPLFGTGTETFAYSYYKFRPQAHNMVSEWDFLYNKAHNEYLNFGANNGLFGLGAYLLFIASFILWNVKFIMYNVQLRTRDDNKDGNYKLYIVNYTLISTLFVGWLSILVTNFFGFSVVIIGLFFFLIPAISVILAGETRKDRVFSLPLLTRNREIIFKRGVSVRSSPLLSACLPRLTRLRNKVPRVQDAGKSCLIMVINLISFYLLLTLAKYWLADVKYAKGYNLNHANEPTTAFDHLRRAVSLNLKEPLYHDELANNLASLAVLANNQKEGTLSASLVESSIAENDRTLFLSPNNVNFFKSRTRIFYTLSQIDPQYNKGALSSILRAAELAPTDAKIRYNLALLYGRVNEFDNAIATLQEAIKLKPNYRDAYYALALYYKDAGKSQEAIDQLRFILEKIDPKDEESKKKLEEWMGVQGASKSAGQR